jgi:hypothetical protein
MQKSAAQDYFTGNQQNKNLVIKVCDAGNAVDLSRHDLYIRFEIFHKIAQFSEL